MSERKQSTNERHKRLRPQASAGGQSPKATATLRQAQGRPELRRRTSAQRGGESEGAPPSEVREERLQKIISAAGVASRRAAEELITQGRVEVNGKTVRTLGTKADPETDEIKVDGRRIREQKRKRYILLYKPRGYVTTRSDPEGRPTVMDLLKGVKEYVYPVGRLDYDSEGLLLLTNDGDMAAHLTHPSHEVEKVYEARVRGVPAAEDLERLARGIVIDGRRTSPAKIRVADRPPKKTESGAEQTFVEVILHEGRQRQVRRMFESIGHPVGRLRRVRIGPIVDEHIPIGHWRELDAEELAKLRRAARLPVTAASTVRARKTPRPKITD